MERGGNKKGKEKEGEEIRTMKRLEKGVIRK